MILLWGLYEDTPLRLVCEELTKARKKFVLINQRYYELYDFDFKITALGVSGNIRYNNINIDLENISSMYIRPQNINEIDTLLSIDRCSNVWKKIQSFEQFLYFISDILPILILNRPSAMLSNNSKPFQLSLIKKNGFEVPDTIITNSLAELEKFQIKYKKVIYKSISSVRSIVNTVNNEESHKIKNLKYFPTQFQEFIEGEDYRIHVLGKKIFPSKIVSCSSDYRYSTKTKIKAVSIPKILEKKCLKLSKDLGLIFSGIDLRYSKSTNKWYCFEVNPSPGFSYYEQSTGQNISFEVSRLL